LGCCALSWCEPRTGLLLSAGLLLARVAGLGLFPLAVQGVRAPARRGLQAALAVRAAALGAGVRHSPLPFDGAPAPLGLGIAASERPLAVVEALGRVLLDHPALPAEALAFAVVAVLAPFARARGRWWIAGLGA